MNNKQPFFGNRIVFGAFIITVFTVAIINNTPAFYMTPVNQEFGFTTAQFSVSYAMAALGAAVGAMFAGYLIEKMPIRLMMVLGSIATGIAFMTLSIATQLWQFYILFFIADASMMTIANVPLTSMLNNWFIDKRGTMTGLVFAGAGLGAIFLSPLTELMIQSLGWKTAVFISGAIILVTAIPVSALIFYKKPSDVHQVPFTYPEGSPQAIKAAEKREKEEREKGAEDPHSGVPKKIALRSSAFLFLTMGLFCMGMVASGVMVHIPNFLYDIDMNAGLVMSVLSIGLLIGTFAIGIVIDRFSVNASILLSTVLFIFGMVSLYFTTNIPALAYVTAVLVGLSVCISAVGPPLLTATIFGMKDYSFLYGLNYALFLVGCMVGPVFCGIIYDTSGSYNLVWIINILIAIGMFVFCNFSLKAGKTLRSKFSESASI